MAVLAQREADHRAKHPDATPEAARAAAQAFIADWFERREEMIRREAADPLRHGHIPPHWKRADRLLEEHKDLLILGGNRSGKSEYAARRVVQTLIDKPGAVAWCFQKDDDNSIEMQQPQVRKYLPSEWRDLKRDKVTSVNYTVANGFSEGRFVLPNGSRCMFRNYRQEVDKIEGGEVDIIWADELVPQSWLETLRYRLVTRGGVLLVTFTPIEGYNATVKDYLTAARTLEWADADLLPLHDGGHERVPCVQLNPKGRAITYFHTKDNPYNPYENLKRTLQSAPRAEILCRAYGVPTKAMASRFPKFGDWNIVPAERVPKTGTRYHVVDPARGRNWFMIWALFAEDDTCYIYRQWPGPYYIPGVGNTECWAKPSEKADGSRGDRQSAWGWGLQRYKEEIERLECAPIQLEQIEPNLPLVPAHPSRALRDRLGIRPVEPKKRRPEEIFQRFMDARAASSATQRSDRAVTLLEECLEIGLDFEPVTGRGGESGDAIDEGVALVNDWLDWDVGKPVDFTNRPRLYVSEDCPDVIYALREWTGADGKDGACKDPVDCVRYLIQSGAGFVAPGAMRARGGGHY